MILRLVCRYRKNKYNIIKKYKLNMEFIYFNIKYNY